MRTSCFDVLRFAWQLLKMQEQRRHLRIGQIIGNRGDAAYYLENKQLCEILEQTRV